MQPAPPTPTTPRWPFDWLGEPNPEPLATLRAHRGPEAGQLRPPTYQAAVALVQPLHAEGARVRVVPVLHARTTRRADNDPGRLLIVAQAPSGASFAWTVDEVGAVATVDPDETSAELGALATKRLAEINK